MSHDETFLEKSWILAMIFGIQAYGVLDDKKLGIPREVINPLSNFMSHSPEIVKAVAVQKQKHFWVILKLKHTSAQQCLNSRIIYCRERVAWEWGHITCKLLETLTWKVLLRTGMGLFLFEDGGVIVSNPDGGLKLDWPYIECLATSMP